MLQPPPSNPEAINWVWSDAHEQLLYVLAKYAGILYTEYQKEYFRYLDELKNFRIPIMICSSLAGFLSLGSSTFVPEEFARWVGLLVGAINLAVTVVSMIENFKRIEVNMNKSYAAYITFRRIHDEIVVLLGLPVSDRPTHIREILESYFERFEACFDEAPPVRKIAESDYFKFYMSQYIAGKSSIRFPVASEVELVEHKTSNTC